MPTTALSAKELAVFQALSYQRLEWLEVAIKAEANLNSLDDDSGYSPLYVAPGFHSKKSNCFAIISELIKNGADVNFPNLNQDTPLHRAAEDNNAEIVRYLLRKEADDTAKSRHGYTPLHCATHRNIPEAKMEEILNKVKAEGKDVEEILVTGGAGAEAGIIEDIKMAGIILPFPLDEYTL